MIEPDPFEPLLGPAWDFRDGVEEETGLRVELGYTTVFQWADKVNEQQNALLSGSYDLVGEWALINREPEAGDRFGTGSLGVLVEGGQILSADRGEALSANIGTGLGVNDDLDNQDIVVSELWFAQNFADDRVTVTIGKIDQTNYFDTNRIANDETVQFLASPLVNNPVVGFPDNGLGANVVVRPYSSEANNPWYFAAGLGSSSADARESTLNNLDVEDVFYAGEVGLTPIFGAGDQALSGDYRALLWSSQSQENGGDSWGGGPEF